MRTILFFSLLAVFSLNAQAIESSECDGKSKWQNITTNSQDISVRKCDVFGLAFFEVKNQLLEDRCIKIFDTQANTAWKHFYLHKGSIKALGSLNSAIPLSQLKVTSFKPKNSRCDFS